MHIILAPRRLLFEISMMHATIYGIAINVLLWIQTFCLKKKTPLIKKVSSVDEKEPQNLLSEVIGKGIWGMQIITFLWSYLMITPSDLSSIAEPREGASKTLPLQTESVFDYNFQLYIYMSWLISAFLIKSKASREKNCLIHYYSGMVVWRRVSAVSMF